MHKIDTDTAVNSEFTDGVPESGQPATRLNASWFNTIQRELSNIVQKAGMELSQSDDGQVLKAILLHAVAEILGDKSHDGVLKLAGESGVNAVLRDSGIWFEYPESGAHVFVSEDGIGFHFYDENNELDEISLNKDGLQLRPDVYVNRHNGVGQFRHVRVSESMKVDGEFNVSDLLKIGGGVVRVLQDLFVAGKVEFGRGINIENGNVQVAGAVSGNVIQANRAVSGKVFCSKIFNATSPESLKDPSVMLSEVAFVGATALVCNMTGEDFVISRQAGGTSHMYLVVNRGEILQFVYDGSKWVHSW